MRILVFLAPFIVAIIVYAAMQAQSVGISGAGLLVMGLMDNPKYVKFGIFTLFLAGALFYYRKFSAE